MAWLICLVFICVAKVCLLIGLFVCFVDWLCLLVLGFQFKMFVWFVWYCLECCAVLAYRLIVGQVVTDFGLGFIIASLLTFGDLVFCWIGVLGQMFVWLFVVFIAGLVV